MSKYNSVKTVLDGITFDSKKEARVYSELKLLVRAGVYTRIELQVPFSWELVRRGNGREWVKKESYVADFVCYKDGGYDVIDAKEYKTAEYKRKKNAMKKLFDIEIIEK